MAFRSYCAVSFLIVFSFFSLIIRSSSARFWLKTFEWLESSLLEKDEGMQNVICDTAFAAIMWEKACKARSIKCFSAPPHQILAKSAPKKRLIRTKLNSQQK